MEFELNAMEFPGQKQARGEAFPLALSFHAPDTDLEDLRAWISSHAGELTRQAKAHGAVLLRGLPLCDAEDFDAFVTAFEGTPFRYLDSLSNAHRIQYSDRVFSANEGPATVTIHLHHEMAQTPFQPRILFFFCEIAPARGGATQVCRSDLLWEWLLKERPGFARDCEEKGLRYSHVMPPVADTASGMGRSWRSTLGVEDRHTAQARMSELGYSWEWLDGDCLRATTPALPAVREIAPGHKAFFNQVIAAHQGWADSRNEHGGAVTFGDGSALSAADVEAVAEKADELSVDLPWRAGDVAILDNHLVMHGRRNFRGERRVLASFLGD